MGIRNINLGLCSGCQTCVDICPMDVIKMDEDRDKAFIAYLRDCQSCFLCELECPTGAIYVSPERERRIPLPW